MKKKLAAVDKRLQVVAVVFGLLLLGFGVRMLLISPQNAKAAKIQSDIDAVQAQIAQRRIDLKKSGEPPKIDTADLFKLARAMPDRPDMPGIILALSQVARESGISFDLIEPAVAGSTDAAVAPTNGYEAQRMHLIFNGDFYGLSDFLYRLRSLVAVRDGKLAASGRLFNTASISFKIPDNFPQISAELYVDAFVYAPTPVAPPAGTATTPSADGSTTTTTPTTTTTTTTTTETPPSGATAAGATG